MIVQLPPGLRRRALARDGVLTMADALEFGLARSAVRRRRLADAELVTRKELLVTALPLSVLEAAHESDSGVLDNALLVRRVSLRQLRVAADRRRGKDDGPAIAPYSNGTGGMVTTCAA